MCVWGGGAIKRGGGRHIAGRGGGGVGISDATGYIWSKFKYFIDSEV